jgi:hypothetical protein
MNKHGAANQYVGTAKKGRFPVGRFPDKVSSQNGGEQATVADRSGAMYGKRSLFLHHDSFWMMTWSQFDLSREIMTSPPFPETCG